MAYTFLFHIELDSSAAELGPEALRALILEQAQVQIPQNPMIMQTTLPDSPKKKPLFKWTQETHGFFLRVLKDMIIHNIRPVPSNVYRTLLDMGVYIPSRGVIASKIQRFKDFLITRTDQYLVEQFPGFLPEDKALYLKYMFYEKHLHQFNEKTLNHFEAQWTEELVLEPEEEDPWTE